MESAWLALAGFILLAYTLEAITGFGSIVIALSLGVVESVDAEVPRRIAHLVGLSGEVIVRYDVEDPEFFAEQVLDDIEARTRQ